MSDLTDKQKRLPKKPVSYSTELAEQICIHIMQGLSLRKICALENMPDISTIVKWLHKGNNGDTKLQSFVAQYAHAREVQAELLADEIVDISDDTSKDEIDHPFVEGATMTNHENIQRAKLRVETRKWIATKLLPKKYGDKQEININKVGLDAIEEKYE